MTVVRRCIQLGERVALSFTNDDTTITFRAPADAGAKRAGRLRHWAVAPVLSYHFPMIAERVRNDKFEQVFDPRGILTLAAEGSVTTQGASPLA